jgi:hypothetical protein
MSLFGNELLYSGGAVENADLVREVYPGWRLRIYVEAGHAAIPLLRRREVDVVEVEETAGDPALRYLHTMTRFEAAADRSAECVVFRDTDSRLNVREAAAVSEWLESGCALHVMQDHPVHHDPKYPMLAGMWGVRGGRLDRIAEWMAPWRAHAWSRSVDQSFLADVVYPTFADADRCEHGTASATARPFPSHPPHAGFVGETMSVADATARLIREATRERRPHRCATVRSADLDDELLVYVPRGRATVLLNESASMIWHLCDGSRSLGDLIAVLRAKYGDSDDMEEEIEAAVLRLAAEGVLRLA